ncbi:MAG: adenosylcobalamin biosynthesis, GlcG-related protein [Halochromatium sp.]|nr:adenosylcobalamin biosynthesis, GlcG-related protein [Halochromatium sp.]
MTTKAMTVSTLALALASSLSATTAFAADDPMMVSVKRLSLETAQRIAQATVDACREKGIQIGVTVVDRDGVVQTQLRDTIAAPITIPISYKKAYTAVNFNAATSALEPRADTAVGRQDFLVMSAGGVTVEVGGSLVAGVGVSGAPAGETDEECAQAGVDAVQDDLDMAM